MEILVILFILALPFGIYWNISHYIKVTEGADNAKKAIEENEKLRNELEGLKREIRSGGK